MDYAPRPKSSAAPLGAILNVFLPPFGQLIQGRLLAFLGFLLVFAIAALLCWVFIGYVLLPLAWIWSIH